jgi:hypothetical protein
MAADLNKFFVTFKIFRDDVQVHSIECPRSLIQTMMISWKYAGSPYVVHVIDHNENFRISSDILNSMELN